VRAEIRVSGIVQGVGFRPFVYRTAVKKSLLGFVRNRGDAYVEIVLEGEKSKIEDFIHELKSKKPPLARIYDITIKFAENKNEFEKFSILKSSENVEFSGSVIPPDVSICEECIQEMRNPQDKRFNYFFITCVNCGPRYTIIERLPYDRVNTTMRDFVMCGFCSKEYVDQSNRRFHAQTVACPSCGPKVYLTTNEGQTVETENPIGEAGKLLEEGYIVAIKGYGGFHVATATTKSNPIIRLRKVKHRRQKPFAIMARNLAIVRSFAEVDPREAELLTSYIRPIVLLKKSDQYYLSEFISPGLHNVGVMLPYTGLHYLLFDDVKEPAFVVTSANPPNEPIVKENVEALRKLGKDVDYFLFHNRIIAQRCDDSVLRLHDETLSIIRRSRGYAPEPIRLKWSAKKCIVGVGAELNVTTCVLLRNKAFISQHIGDVENLETLLFLEDALSHLLRLTNSKVEAIACDLHPKFTTTRLAHDLAAKFNCPVITVQHHHAHIAALMAEHGLDEIIGISCDGYGYGSDGNPWGGEILHCTKEGFKRLGHLQEQPMIGGDLATRYPMRMVAGILHRSRGTDVEQWLRLNSKSFPHGEKEVEIILQQLEKGSKVKTTSCGRILDSVAAILGICYERTYEGESALKLESAAINGGDVLNLSPIIHGKTINTTTLVEDIFNLKKRHPVSDLAFSAQSYLAKALALFAVKQAERLGVDTIGFSGGVAYNKHITLTVERIVNENNFRFVNHRLVPPGDGGISFGQVVAAAGLLNT
jgi:hydrogenase maturation protein HypF